MKIPSDMKKLFLLLVSLNLYLVSSSQIIRGNVLDKETKSPIDFAYLYFNGTSAGTQSDQNGYFELDVSKNAPNPLTVSAVGYYSTTLTEYLTGKPLSIYLSPKIFELSEINIGAKSLAKKRIASIKEFKDIFLGTTENAKYCEILNESDIKFDYNSHKDTLRAFSSKPLLIYNKALGYYITYYLDKFEYKRSNRSFIFQGNLSFKEDLEKNEFQKQIIENRRKNAYLGSRMHFFRALWHDELESNGFTVKNSFGRNLYTKEFVFQDVSGRKYLQYKGSLGICYYSDMPFSHLEPIKDRIYFDENGYFDSFGIIWEGYIADKKIADMLPLEYLIEPAKGETKLIKANIAAIDLSEKDSIKYIEKAYLHTDRDYYNPGDDIWFKSYVVEGLNHKLSNKSGNLHVELISPEAKIIDSRIVRLEKGLGIGDFVIPDTLRSGDYRLRAYTNFMRNFGDLLFYNKEIKIINSSDTINSFSENIIMADNDFDISFFPEGGSLVDNVSSIIAFKAVDGAGSGCDVSGEVYTSGTDKLITTFSSSHLGMGTFTLEPFQGSSYYVIVRNSNGIVLKREIPKSFSTGFVLNASLNELSEHVLSIKTNSETLPHYLGRELLIKFSAHKINLKALSVRINSFRNNIILPTDDIPDGIVMITLYDLDNRPLCERLIYIQNSDPINLNIETDKKVYKQRDSVSVKLSLLEDISTGQEAFLSCAVTDIKFTDETTLFPTTISSWFLLESDVHGSIENPSYYFDPSNHRRLKDLDLLLLTQGWRDFEWKYKEQDYLPESGFTISGKLRKSLIDSPIKGASITVGIFQNDKNIFSTISTDSTGRFHLDLENLIGSARVVISALDKKGNSQGRLILDSINFNPPKVEDIIKRKSLTEIEKQNETENLTILKETDLVKKSIKKKYTLSDTISLDEVTIVAKRKETPRETHVNQSRIVYGQPDKEVIVAQNESARTVRGLLEGRVAGLSFVQETKSSSGIIIHGITSFGYSNEPLFLLDGMVSSYGEINKLPMEWIDRVDVIKSEKTAAYGVRGAFGVISVITKTYKELPYKPVSYSVNSTISGYNASRIFYSPKHVSKFQAGQMPDLRFTLYWFPDIKAITNHDYLLKYFNADVSATYNIIVEGITTGGIPITGKTQYKVE
jgi:hypothetical protein